MTTSEDGYDKLFEDLLRESARAAADFDSDETEYEENEQQELSDRNALRRHAGRERPRGDTARRRPSGPARRVLRWCRR